MQSASIRQRVAGVGCGSDVLSTCTPFSQLAIEYQSHTGAVNTASTPNVQYAYADGSTNTVRLTETTYPSGRVISLDYGASGSMPDALSRLDTLVDATPGTTLASFTYLGLDTTVQMSYPQPGVQLTLIGTPGGDGGDQYVGLDRFGRLVDQRWMNSASTDIERVQYGYTPASNRIWRHNTVAAALGVGQDEYYAEDGLYQLSVRQQGTLNSGKTGISGTPAAEEDFTYDPTGNWANYETKTSGTVTLNQPRAHNVDNEILTLSGSTSLVGYDHVGNMTTAPQPAAGTSAYQLTWDAWNRLVKVATASPASTVAVYAYDGLTRRTRKVAGTTTSDFYYLDQWKVLEVDMVTGSTASLKQFVWRGCDEDKLILCDEPASAPIPRLYAMDDGKNVTAICDTIGTIQERYGYSGFGAPVFMNPSFVAQASSAYIWETLFCGYRYDSTTGLYHVRYRYLHAGLGRWLGRDPSVDLETIDRAQLYWYVQNEAQTYYENDGARTSKPKNNKTQTPQPCGKLSKPNCPPGSKTICVTTYKNTDGHGRAGGNIAYGKDCGCPAGRPPQPGDCAIDQRDPVCSPGQYANITNPATGQTSKCQVCDAGQGHRGLDVNIPPGGTQGSSYSCVTCSAS